MYLFLNEENKLFNFLGMNDDLQELNESNLSYDKTKKAEAFIREKKNNILLEGLNNCINYNALYYYSDSKPGFNKNTVILSLPVDPIHYETAHEYYGKNVNDNLQRKLMFLSSPLSAYRLKPKIKLHFYCTKEIAVKEILKKMRFGEKMIIFSLFKDVINSYYELCESMNYPSLIITGKHKGEKLQDKLVQFEHSNHFKVLLTTLQKSAEGLNLQFANHIIILEFWWNPQKLFQAMNRIDRLSQERDIYIYILCYNEIKKIKNESPQIKSSGIENIPLKYRPIQGVTSCTSAITSPRGALLTTEEIYALNEKTGLSFVDNIIKEERMFLLNMNRKVDDINSFFEELYNKNSDYYSEKPQLKIMPDIKEFQEFGTIENDLSSYLEELYLYAREEFAEQEDVQIKGISYQEIQESVQGYIYDYHTISDMLLRFPWRIYDKPTYSYLVDYFNWKIQGSDGKDIIEATENPFYTFEHNKFDYNYPFLFLDTINYTIKTQKGYENVDILFAVVKHNNGRFHVLSPQSSLIHNMPDLLNFTSNVKIKSISTITASYENMVNAEMFKRYNYYPRVILSLSHNYLKIFRDIENKMHPEQIEKLNADIASVFAQSTKANAIKLIENYLSGANGLEILLYRRIKRLVYRTAPLYEYPLEVRSVIGTTNIIAIIGLMISSLLESKTFYDKKEAENFISIATHEIVKKGEKLIPNWDFMKRFIQAK